VREVSDDISNHSMGLHTGRGSNRNVYGGHDVNSRNGYEGEHEESSNLGTAVPGVCNWIRAYVVRFSRIVTCTAIINFLDGRDYEAITKKRGKTMCGYMKQRMAMQSIGLDTNGISQWSKESRDDLYAMLVEAGLFWDVAGKRWRGVEREGQHLRDTYGPEAEWEFYRVLRNGGILDDRNKRTTQVNLPAKFTVDFMPD